MSSSGGSVSVDWGLGRVTRRAAEQAANVLILAYAVAQAASVRCWLESEISSAPAP